MSTYTPANTAIKNAQGKWVVADHGRIISADMGTKRAAMALAEKMNANYTRDEAYVVRGFAS